MTAEVPSIQPSREEFNDDERLMVNALTTAGQLLQSLYYDNKTDEYKDGADKLSLEELKQKVAGEDYLRESNAGLLKDRINKQLLDDETGQYYSVFYYALFGKKVSLPSRDEMVDIPGVPPEKVLELEYIIEEILNGAIKSNSRIRTPAAAATLGVGVVLNEVLRVDTGAARRNAKNLVGQLATAVAGSSTAEPVSTQEPGADAPAATDAEPSQAEHDKEDSDDKFENINVADAASAITGNGNFLEELKTNLDSLSAGLGGDAEEVDNAELEQRIYDYFNGEQFKADFKKITGEEYDEDNKRHNDILAIINNLLVRSINVAIKNHLDGTTVSWNVIVAGVLFQALPSREPQAEPGVLASSPVSPIDMPVIGEGSNLPATTISRPPAQPATSSTSTPQQTMSSSQGEGGVDSEPFSPYRIDNLEITGEDKLEFTDLAGEKYKLNYRVDPTLKTITISDGQKIVGSDRDWTATFIYQGNSLYEDESQKKLSEEALQALAKFLRDLNELLDPGYRPDANGRYETEHAAQFAADRFAKKVKEEIELPKNVNIKEFVVGEKSDDSGAIKYSGNISVFASISDKDISDRRGKVDEYKIKTAFEPIFNGIKLSLGFDSDENQRLLQLIKEEVRNNFIREIDASRRIKRPDQRDIVRKSLYKLLPGADSAASDDSTL